MVKFVLLSQLDGSKVYVNPQHIILIRKDDNYDAALSYSELILSDGTAITVLESYSTIMNRIG